MAVRKSVRERLEEHKTGKASTSKTTTGSNTGSTLTTQKSSTRESVSDRLTRHKAQKAVGFDTFDSDLASVSETISKIYGGWQDADTMKNTKDTVAKMYERLNAANTYVGDNSLGDLVSSYKSVLDQWDNVAGTYSQFQNADAYSSAKKNYELSEKYKGLDYAGVQKAKLNSEDADWLSEYGVNVGYSSLKDYNTELNDLSNMIASLQGEKKQNAQAYYDKLKAKANQYALENASEKYAFLKENEDFEQGSQYQSTQNAKKFLGMEYTEYGDEVYEFINNVNGARDNLIAQYKESNGPTELEQHGYEYMTDDEVKMFNYLYNQDKEKAYDFLDDIAVSLSKRSYDQTTETWNQWADDSALASIAMSAATPIFNMAGGMGSALATLEEAVTGKEYNPYSSLRMPSNAASDIREYVGENIAEATEGMEIGNQNIPSFLYQTGMSIADTALGSRMFGKGFTVVMGMNSATQKAKELKEAGEDEETILKGAVASGLAEAAFEKLSIDNLLKPKSAETLLGVLRETAKQMGIEASEEIFTEIANTVSDTLIRQNTSDLAKSYEEYLYRGYTEEEAKKLVGKDIASNVMWSGIGGALSGGVMGGVSSGANLAANASLGSAIRGNNNVSDLGEITSGLNNDAYAKYLQLIDSGKIKNGQLGGLYSKVSEEVDTNYQAEEKNAVMHTIANRATEFGEGKNAGVIASAIQKNLNNQSLSSEERTALKSDTAQAIMQEIERGEITVNRSGSYKTAYDTKARMQSVLTTPKSEETARVQKRVAEMNTGAETMDNESGQKIEIEGMRKDEEGNTVLQTSEGERLLSDVTLSDHTAEVVAMAEGMDDTKADTFVSLYKEGIDVEEYKTSFELAFSYGQNGFGAENVLKNKGVLTEEQAASAYETGIRFATEARQKQIDEVTAKHFSGVTPGTFDDSAVDYGKINTQQKAAIDFSRMLSKATGVNIVFFQSEADENGHRTAENGRYDRSTNTVYLDVYAGVTENIAKDSILPTLSHETTHWMKDKAPEAYKKLSGVVMDVLSKEYGVSPVDLVHAEMKRYKDAYGKEVSEEYAQDELIARASEDMLSGNRDVQEIISQMDEKTAKTFSERLKVAFEKIKEWLADLLSNYKSNSEEAKIVRKYADKVNELQEAWDDAFDKAVKANQVLQTSQETMPMAASDRVRKSDRNKDSIADIESRLLAQLQDWLQGKMPKNGYFELGTTPAILQKFGAKELPIIMEQSVVWKFTSDYKDHAIALDEIAKLPSQIAEPVLLFKGSVPNSFVILTELEDKHGREVIAALHLDKMQDRIRVNRVASIYGKDNAAKYVTTQIDNGNLLYADKKRSEIWFTSRGLQLPKLVQTLISTSNDSIPQNGKNATGNSQFSERDSEGNGLTKAQIEYFKNSKVRDENGNLKVMYHGTENASFTEFNPEYSDDGISLFFTDSKTVAKGYSGTMEEYIVGKKYTVAELTNIINDSYYYVTEEDGKYHIIHNNYGRLEKEYTADTLEEMQDYVFEEYGSVGAGNYKVYLNIENPLVVEGNNNYWDELPGIDGGENTTRDYAEYAKSHGYDGVIFNNIVDTAIYASGSERFESAMVAIAFDANQVKSVANENPSGDADIRYSDRDSNGNGLTKEQVEYFKESKVRDAEGNLKPMYHGTGRADRVGYHFREDRATSGPMAFFTDSKSIADNYARDKQDTSIAYDEMYRDYYTQFRIEVNGKNLSISDAWDKLPTAKRVEIRKKAPHVTTDYEEILYDESQQYGPGGLDPYTINMHRGNMLKALTDAWLEFGTLMGEEEMFLDVLKMVGLDNVQYMNPDMRDEKTYQVYLNVTNPFVTTDISDEMLQAFKDAADIAEFTEGNSADVWDKRNIRPEAWIKRLEDDIADGTTHAWTSIPDFVTNTLKAHGYDGIFDEGGKSGGTGHQVVIPFYSNQIKDIANANPTENVDIRYSERNAESIYDAVGQLKRLQKENEKLKKDVERLRQRNKLERTVTGGTVLNENQISSVASYILNNADSTYSKEQFTEELKDIYKYLQSEDVTWDILMLKATDAAQRIVAEKRERTVPNDYAKEILYTLRNTKVSLNETQKAEAKYAYGKDWYKMYFGRVLVTNDGIPLDSMWQEWAQMYPDVFDADMSDADMATEVLNAYDAVKASSEIVEAFDRTEMEREIAVEIYNQFWNVSPVRTLADKYEREIANLKHEKNKALYEKKLAAAQKYDQAIKQLKYEHRVEMKDMKAQYNQRKTEAVYQTRERYQKTIKELRTKRAEEIRQIKEKSREYNQAYRDRLMRKAEIDKITNKALKLNTWLVKNSKEAHVPEILKKPVAAVLKSLNFSSERLLGLYGGEQAGTPTNKDISLSKAFEELADMVGSVNDAQINDKELDGMYGHLDLPADFVDFVRSTSASINDLLRAVGDNEYILNQLTLDQLKDVNNILNVLSHTVTQTNKALAASHGKSIATLAQETMIYANEQGKHSKMVGGLTDFFNFSNALPYYAFKRFGEGGRRIFEAFQDGWDKFAFNVKKIMDYSDNTYTAKEVKEWQEQVHEFDVLNGTEKVHVKMTTAQIMSLYCLQKREQAKGHLIGGGIRVADFKEGKGKVTQPDGVTLQEKDINNIISKLTDRQLDVADRLQEFMNTVCTDWGNEVSMIRFGYKAFGEENYFPISSDTNNVAQDDAKEQQNSLFRLLNMSFTKGTIKNANNRVVIDNIFDVFASHTSDMAKYNALALPVLDAFKWYNYKEKIKVNPADKNDRRFTTKGVKQSVEKAYGAGAKKYIVQFLRDINGANSGGIEGAEQFAKKLMANYKVASVGANLRVAVLQPTSYIRASVLLDAKYLTKAFTKKPQIEKARETCGIALWKSLGFYDTNIAKGVAEQIKHDDSVMDKVKEGSMKLAEWGDSITWGYLYNACEAEVSEKHPGLKGMAKDEAVAKRLREVIYATQVVDSTMTRTQMMRNRSTWIQMATSFMSEPMISYNLLHDCFMQYNADKRITGSKGTALKRNGKKISRAMLAYTMATFASALAGALPDTLRDDDEEKDFAETFISNAAENAVSDALGMIPLFKDVVSLAQGYDVARMDTQALASVVRAYQSVTKAVENGEVTYKTVYSVMRAISQITGIPLSNLMRDGVAIWNNTIGENYDSVKAK